MLTSQPTSRNFTKFERDEAPENQVNIIRNGQKSSNSHPGSQFTGNRNNLFNSNQNPNSHKFLGNKREADCSYNLEKPIGLPTGSKLIKMIKTDNSDDAQVKKVEFKLSHILNGENTVTEATREKKSSSEFFDDDFVDGLMYWKKSASIGPGFNNLGNTCFLNSVLQSLIYTPALRNYFTYSDHMKMCRVKGLCFLCEFGRLVNALSGSITPRNIIQNISLISKNLRIGRQEDAHEFLLYLLDSLERSTKQFKLSSGKSFVSSSDVQDNLIQKLFGGKMVSSVTCLKCKKTYNKMDNYLDVSLHIYNSDNIERCFENFCKSESLSGANKYFCENCKNKNDAIKKFSFDNCKYY